ncbi:ABC transporter permease [Zavarzinella formosa]|uniref:ABC transporter permease n=1 Tax=Zavarzinella formosa TaxID=360055 RepID=UPI00031D0295|nr:ABC transporter permease [Zavarzinella formosa]
MVWIALKMLTGDRTKYMGIVFGVAFASMLISHQVSIFLSIMARCTSLIRNVQEGEIFVMDPTVRQADEVIGLSDDDLHRVRGVDGVAWAVKFYRGTVRARLPEGGPKGHGDFRSVVLLGLDDASLVGAPRKMLMGSVEDLRKPDAVIIDEAGYFYLFPGQPHQIGQTIEMTDRRAEIVGICEVGQPFQSMPIFYTKYSRAMQFSPPERRLLSYIIVEPESGVPAPVVAQRIMNDTGLQALTKETFRWNTIQFYVQNTGIPFNFGITVVLGFVVGIAIAGQTFYLFTIENLKQFGALKAMGTSNLRIVGMILVQALVVGLIGYGLGVGGTALFFTLTQGAIPLKGFHMLWQVMAGTAAAVSIIVVLASLLSIRKVLVLEPAVVFR